MPAKAITTPLPMFVSPDEAAHLTGTCTRTIRRGIANGTIPAKRLGRRILIDRQALLDSLRDVESVRSASAARSVA